MPHTSPPDPFMAHIRSARAVIRYHRDQKMDDRCWLEDYKTWSVLPDAQPIPTHLPSYEKIARVQGILSPAQTPVPDPIPTHTIMDSSKWDDDLSHMSDEQLAQELQRIHSAMRPRARSEKEKHRAQVVLRFGAAMRIVKVPCIAWTNGAPANKKRRMGK